MSVIFESPKQCFHCPITIPHTDGVITEPVIYTNVYYNTDIYINAVLSNDRAQ